MEKALAILTMLGILSVLIIVHECGHFLVARFFGFQTPVFGFGLPFGPSWTVGKKWGTEFKIHACLLGGYVAIPELGDESNADAFGPPEKPFRKFPIWQRALVAVAGVTFNVIFAYFVQLVMVTTLGDPTFRVVSEGTIKENPIAQNAGFKTGDVIIDIDGTKVKSTPEAIAAIQAHKNKPMVVTIRRPAEESSAAPAKDVTGKDASAKDASAGKDSATAAKSADDAEDIRKVTESEFLAKENAMPELKLQMTPNDKGQIGLKLSDKLAYYSKVDGNPIEVAGYAAYKLTETTKNMLDALGQMVQGLAHGIMGGKKAAGGAPAVGIQDLHGVLAVVVFGADVAQQDWSKLLIFTIMISMDLAIINLVPWPALDGGHLAFMLYEAIRGKPMEERAQGEIVKWGFISLIMLMVVIMVNDVSALVTGKLSFKAMKEKAKEVRQQQDADEKAADDAAKSSSDASKSDADAAKSDADAAKSDADAVKSDAAATNLDAKSDASAAQKDADAAKKDADNAKADAQAGSDAARKDADAAQKNADEAQKDADAAKKDADAKAAPAH